MSNLWEKQWQLFAPNFHAGKAYISLKPYGVNREFPLLPGGGFGDASHPTTQAMLAAMAGRVIGKTVIDVGCGSGILSIAAALMGASYIFALDICPYAIEHTKKNIALNKLESMIQINDSIPINFRAQIACINMIHAEQKEVFYTIAQTQEILASGILTQEVDTYLAWIQQFNLQGSILYTKGEWCCLLLNQANRPCTSLSPTNIE